MLDALADFLNARRVGSRAWWGGVAGIAVWLVSGAVVAALLAQIRD